VLEELEVEVAAGVGTATAVELASAAEESSPEAGVELWADCPPMALAVTVTLSAGALAVCETGSSVTWTVESTVLVASTVSVAYAVSVAAGAPVGSAPAPLGLENEGAEGPAALGVLLGVGRERVRVREKCGCENEEGLWLGATLTVEALAVVAAVTAASVVAAAVVAAAVAAAVVVAAAVAEPEEAPEYRAGPGMV
jgi:hypothetical protein